MSGVIPAARISEGLFTIVRNTLIKGRDDPAAPTYLMGFDSTPVAIRGLIDREQRQYHNDTHRYG